MANRGGGEEEQNTGSTEIYDLQRPKKSNSRNKAAACAPDPIMTCLSTPHTITLQISNGANTQRSNALTASLTCSQLAAGDAPEGEPAASLQKPVEVGKPPVGVTMVPVAAYLPAVVYLV